VSCVHILLPPLQQQSLQLTFLVSFMRVLAWRDYITNA
jgi:hypothetical protein